MRLQDYIAEQRYALISDTEAAPPIEAATIHLKSWTVSRIL